MRVRGRYAATHFASNDRLQEALDCYHRSLLYRSDAPAVQVALAEIYRQLGRPQRALATLDHLADHHTPEELPPRAWLLRGMALADLGEDAKAKQCLQLASQYAGETQTGLVARVSFRAIQLGRPGRSEIVSCRVLKNEPENPAAWSFRDSSTNLSYAWQPTKAPKSRQCTYLTNACLNNAPFSPSACAPLLLSMQCAVKFAEQTGRRMNAGR